VRRSILSLAGLLMGVALAGALALSSARAEEEAKPFKLFNGTDLSGWKTFIDPRDKGKTKAEDVWSVEKGVIVCKGKPFGYIITEKEYGDYVLELEWRWAPGSKGGNSGVLCHVTGKDKIWPHSWEAQLWSGYAGDIWLVDGFKMDVDEKRKDPKNARHYFRMKTKDPVEKEIGQWNKYRITCKGDAVKLEVNGVLVNEGKGAENSKGKILLQSEGAEVHFRNITLTPLKRPELGNRLSVRAYTDTYTDPICPRISISRETREWQPDSSW